MLFAEATREPTSPWSSYVFDGILGFGYPQISVNGIPPFFVAAFASGAISQPKFAFYLADEGLGSSGSELVLGGVDSTKYTGSITYTPVTVKGYWQFAVSAFAVGGTTISGPISAIADTGTSFLAIPASILTAILNQIPSSSYLGSGAYAVACSEVSKLPSLNFTIAGKQFSLSGPDYTVFYTSSGATACVLGIESFSGNLWILGDVFLRKYYTVFDYGNAQIGFALAA